jgi:hypothetical protein
LYVDLREDGIIDSIAEFMRLNLGQIRFFLRKKKQYQDLKRRNEEAARRLRGNQPNRRIQ